MKAIILVRVSTRFQDADPQEEKLMQYAREDGITDFHVIRTVESGLMSSKSKDKIGTNELFKKLEEDPTYKTIYCTELSRISRVQSVLHYVKEYLVNNGVQLIIPPNQLKLLKENGNVSEGAELYFTIFSHFASNEVKLLKERSRTARIFYVKQGLSVPGKTLFGYKRIYDEGNKKYRFIIDPEQGEVIKNIFNWYLDGLPNSDVKQASTGNIAKYCIGKGLHKYTHSKRNINHLLKEKAYTGKKEFVFRNSDQSDESHTNIEVPYETLISDEVFYQVQTKMGNANSSLDKSVKITLLSKLITCKSCHTKLVANYRSSRNGHISNSYRCGRRTSARSCINKIDIGMNMLDSAVWSLLKSNNRFIKDLFEREAALINTTIPELENTIIFHSDKISELKIVENQLDTADALWNSMSTEKKVSEIPITQQRLLQKIEITNKISKEEKKVKKLEKALRQAKDLQNNASFMDQSIAELESSKELIKRYINLLIQDIRVVLHTRELSVFTLFFKMPFFLNTKLKVSLASIFNQEPVNKSSFPITLIIEKRDSNRKKLFWIAGHSSVDKEKIIIYDELSERLDSNNIISTFPFTDIRNRRIEEMAEDVEWTEDSYDDDMLNLLKQIQYHTLLFS